MQQTTKTYKDKETFLIESNEKWFSFYEALPWVLTIFLAIASIVFAIIFSLVFDHFLLWIILGVGIVLCLLTFVLLKITSSYKILNIYYLKKISQGNLTLTKAIETVNDSKKVAKVEGRSTIVVNDKTKILDREFYKQDSLEKLVIGNSVTRIGSFAFYGCESLTNVVLSENLTKIGDYAFCRCNSLKSIKIPKGVTSIGVGAFLACSSLTEIVIPESVKNIGEHAFSSCKNLTIYCEAICKPIIWDSKWNSSNCQVVWNYKGK